MNRKEQIEFYGPTYKGHTENLASFERRDPRLKEWFYDPFVKEHTRLFRGKRTLDVGCGPGHQVWAFNLDGVVDCYGCDISEWACRHSLLEVKKKIICCDVVSMSFKDNSFHNVMAWNTLEHISFDLFKRAINEIFRVCSETFIAIIPVVLDGSEEKEYWSLTTNDKFNEHMISQGPQWWIDNLKREGWEQEVRKKGEEGRIIINRRE